MSVTVRYYGTNKPGPGVKPLRIEKRPFGKPNPVSWMTGKHLALRKEGPVEPVETSPVPDGENAGDLLYWDADDGAWVVLDVSEFSDGDVLVKTSSGWEKKTPVEITALSDVNYDSTTRRVRKSYRTAKVLEAGTETVNEMIVGGQAVPES
jgi:hypothetical protein